MKNIIISNNKDTKSSKSSNTTSIGNVKNSPKDFSKQIYDMIRYFQNLIQKTILSIQSYKKINIIGTNELIKKSNKIMAIIFYFF